MASIGPGARHGRGTEESLRSGQLKMTSIKLSDMRVYLDDNFAVVTGAATQDGTFEGHSVAPKIVFTDSFFLQDGPWRAVASQRTTAPAK